MALNTTLWHPNCRLENETHEQPESVALSKEKILGIGVAVGIILALVLSTMNLRQHTCEVCITYLGNTNCAIATGTTRAEAQRSATSTACAPISGGVTQTIQCGNHTPDKVEWID